MLVDSSHTEGAGLVQLQLRLSATSASVISVPFSVTGSATAGADYTVAPSPVTFPAGSNTASIDISLLDDALVEGRESLVVALGAPTGAALGTMTQHALTVLDDEAAATVGFTTASSTLGEDDSAFDVVLQLSSPLTEATTVAFTVSGTAVVGADFTHVTSPLVIPGGQTSANLTIVPIDDGSDEPNETIVLDLGAITNAAAGATTQHIVTLTDDDLPPSVRFSLSSSLASEAGAPIALTVELGEVSGFPVTVAVAASGSAQAGVDYSWTGGPIVIPAGTATVPLTITPLNDTQLEGAEVATFTLSAPQNAVLGARSTHDLTLLDDETVPAASFAVAAANVTEGAGTASVSVTLSGPPATVVSVPYTVGGTATQPTDFTVPAGPLVFAVGQTTKAIQVTIVDDAVPEPTETVTFTLGAPTGATLGATTQHDLSLLDDDGNVTVAFAAAASTSLEGAGGVALQVSLSAIASGPVSVPFSFSGSASPADYVPSASPLVIPAGASSGTIVVSLVQDALYEGAEQLVVALGAPTGATLGAQTQHTLTITDDDQPPAASFTLSRTLVDEISGGFSFRIQLSAVSGLPATIPFVLAGPASGPSDIVAPVSPVIIPAGQTFVDVPVGLIVDRVGEAGETLTIQLQAPMIGATPGAITSLLVGINDGVAGPIALPPALAATPSSVPFPQLRVLESSAAQQVVITNVHSAPLTFLGLAPESGNVAGFSVAYPGLTLPMVLAPAQSVIVEVRFTPLTAGPREAVFVVRQNFGGFPPTRVSFSGIALGLPGADVVLNAGGDSYVSPSRQHWAKDYGVTQSEGPIVSVIPVLGTTDDPLYQYSRFGQVVEYALPVPNGTYDVRFHSWEPVQVAPGARVFDGIVEGQLAFDDVDVFAAVGGRTAWISDAHRAQVSDGVLDLRFVASVGRAIVSGIEVRAVPVISSPTTSVVFGTVDQGAFGQRDIELVNSGAVAGRLTGLQIAAGLSGPANEFAVEVGGVSYFGGQSASSFGVNLVLPPGASTFLPVVFTPTLHRDNDLELRLTFESGEEILVPVTGTGGANAGWGFLHPVIDQNPLVVIDYDGSGSEAVQLLGQESHTHEPGRFLSAFEWRVNGAVVGSTASAVATLPLGPSTVALTITDSNTPASQATDSRQFDVYPASAVPGVLVSYYDASVAGEVYLLDHVPAQADFVARQNGLSTTQVAGKIGASHYATDVMLRWDAQFVLATASTVTFAATGGDGRRVLVDGSAVTGPRSLAAGAHSLEVRFAVSDVNDLPLQLTATVGGAPIPGFDASLTHGEGQQKPVIHSMPTQGTDLGGNDIVIEGFGFFPASQVVVHWGNTAITPASFVAATPERLEFLSPPGSGPIQVTVTTPNGTSKPQTFTYSPSGPVPVRWNLLFGSAVSVNDPTRGAWGPDGRLWVALLDGSLRAVTYDDNYAATNVQYYAGVSGMPNKDVLGIAFNPYDVYDPNVPSSLKVYVAHGDLYQNGGGVFNTPSAFSGTVSRLTGPNFSTPTPVVLNLPVSNHDHSINGLVFDGNGDLLIASGGNTNAGVQWPLMGDVPESPLSGAILRAFTSRSGFNGDVAYLDRVALTLVDDQRYGGDAIVAPGVDVEVFAPGLRNSLDLLLHTNGYIYATDNGPNDPYGPASTGASTQGGNPHPWFPDELALIEYGNYYGHANRARGYDDPRQNVYRDTVEPSIPHAFTQCLTEVDSSTNGIDEYRATAFNSQLRGQLVLMKWGGPIKMFELTPDGRRLASSSGASLSPWNSGLDVVTGPGGAIVSIDYGGDQLRVQVPDDIAAVGLVPYDVFPARALRTGGVPFVIGGLGFGTLATTSVTFNGVPAVLSSVSSKRIRGVVPAQAAGVIGSVDVAVTVSSNTVVIPAGFQYLPATPGSLPGLWRTSTQMPAQMGEVACGEVDGMIYVFGEGDMRTFRYDVLNDTWNSTLPTRPFHGTHHACEVVNGKVYLIGGLYGGDGRVQIFDPMTNQWTMGAQMPWAGGSCVTALIGGRIYVGGGIVGSSTVANFAVYDPALDSWTSLGAMPLGVNHAAASTDGQRMYVFGGRQGANVPQVGFTNVQVFDPVAGTWQASTSGQVAAMPFGRGGTGKAVWYRGEFYVLGGEDPTHTFGEVQAYNPATNTWRRDADMPTARHGIFPVLFQDRLFVIGGGLTAGPGASALVEVFQRP
ncbi:MAG: Calx-beta domain-containing protein [Planctomycetota bacterium]